MRTNGAERSKTCVICGAEFKTNLGRATCNEECRKLRLSIIEDQKNPINTELERYGLN